MKEDYRWNYNIKIKTKDGTYEYEQPIEKLEELLEKHKDYTEVQAAKVANEVANSGKRLVKKNGK